VLYTVQAAATKEKKDDEKADDSSTADNDSKVDEAIRDSQIKYIEGIKDKKQQLAAFNILYPALAEKFPSHPQLLALRLTVLNNTSTDKSSNEEAVKKLTEAADDVVASMDQQSIQLQLAKQIDSRDKESKRKRKDAEEKKSILIAALHSKAEILAEYINAQLKENKGVSDEMKNAFEATYKDLVSWVGDLTSKDNRSKYLSVTVLHYKLQKQYGHALKLLNAEIDADAQPKKSLAEERLGVLKQLGWQRWAQHVHNWMIRNYPSNYTLF
jgi:hypothetical protein